MNFQDPPTPAAAVHRLTVEACRRAVAFAARHADPDTGPAAVPADVVPEGSAAVACRWLEPTNPEQAREAATAAVEAACQDLICAGAVPEAGAAWYAGDLDGVPEDLVNPPGFSEALARLGLAQVPTSTTAETASPPQDFPMLPGKRLLVVVGVWDASGPRMGRRFRQAGDVVLLLHPAPESKESASVLHTTVLGLICEGVVHSACGTAGCGVEGALAAGGRTVSRASEPAERPPESPSAVAASSKASLPGVMVSAAPADVGRLIRQTAILGVAARAIGTVGEDPAAAAPEGSTAGGASEPRVS